MFKNTVFLLAIIIFTGCGEASYVFYKYTGTITNTPIERKNQAALPKLV